MKRNVFWLGMLAMVLAFGMTVVGCPGGDDDTGTDPFAGTWVWAENGQKIIAEDGSWNWYDDQNNVVASGTYTTSGNNVTLSSPSSPSENNINATISGNTVSIPITANDGTPVTAILTKQGSGNSPGGSNPAPKFTAAQIYTLDDDGVFTAFSGTGTEMDIEGFMNDNYGQYDNLGKIGTMSSDGKLTFELPSTIADDKLFLVPTEYGGNGVIKFVLVNIRVYSDNSDVGKLLELYNSSNTNKEVNFQYYDRDFSVMGLSIKRGWNYVEMNWDDDSPQIIFDISNHKWVIEERW